MSEIRLSKLMAQQGLCSRREADRFIEQGLVQVDGIPVSTLGTKVLSSQRITLAPEARQQLAEKVTVLLNKPMGYVSGLPEDGHQSAVMLIQRQNQQFRGEKVPGRHGLAPAGRLDIDSMGLIVFTNDGRVARQLVGEKSGENDQIEKEYLVWVQGTINQNKLELLRHGLALDGKSLQPTKVDHLKGSQLRMVLIEGRKRQIRRMCKLVELHVSRLIRVRIGKVKLGRLEAGKWRLLKSGEMF